MVPVGSGAADDLSVATEHGDLARSVTVLYAQIPMIVIQDYSAKTCSMVV